jgi:hypothetical protein
VARSKSKRVELNRFLKLQALGQQSISLVGFKLLKDEVAEGVPGILPPRHHLQNAGDDELRDVAAHVVQDGIRPPTRELARLVRAKTGRSPLTAPPEPQRARVMLADNTGVELSVLGYADPDMQAEYEHHLHGSISQALGRSRSVMRTALNPVRNILLGNVAPPGEVFTQVTTWRQERPGRLGEMVLRRRVHLNAATMAAIHDDLFQSDKAASSARARWVEWFGDIWTRLREWVKHDRAPWARVRWQRAGQGAALQWSLCPEAEVAAMRAEVAAKFGEPVYWQVERFTEGTKADSLLSRLAAPAKAPEAVGKEDIPENAHHYFADSAMSSYRARDLMARKRETVIHRLERPPDG